MAANAQFQPNPELELTTEKQSDRIIVRGTGRITASSSEQLLSTLRDVIAETKHVVIDLTGVDYVDSSGLGALVTIHLHASRAGCLVDLANPRQRIRDLFKITKLASLFEDRQENYFGDF